MSSRCILSSNSDCESHTRLSSWLAPPAKDATTLTRQRTISVSLLPKEAVLWDCSQWLVMVPLNIFKVHYSLHVSKTNVPACKLSLMKSQNKATDVLNTNYITQFKSFFKKNCAFALYFLSHYVCRGNAFRGICTLPSRLEDFSSVVPSWLGPYAENWESLASFKGFGEQKSNL